MIFLLVDMFFFPLSLVLFPSLSPTTAVSDCVLYYIIQHVSIPGTSVSFYKKRHLHALFKSRIASNSQIANEPMNARAAGGSNGRTPAADYDLAILLGAAHGVAAARTRRRVTVRGHHGPLHGIEVQQPQVRGQVPFLQKKVSSVSRSRSFGSS